MIKWIKKKLGITLLENELQRLYELEHYALADVVDSLSESMVVIGGEDITLQDVRIKVPQDKKYGVIILGKHNIISGAHIDHRLTRTTTEYVDDEG